jgi:hypothetical protein
MIKLIDLLFEDFPKGKYISLKGEELVQAKQDLFNLIQTAYKDVGGHLNFKSPENILDPDIDFWRAADLDEDPGLDVVYFGKKTSFGNKHTGMGHDGKKPNIKNLLIKKSNDLKAPGNYIEVSGDAYKVFVEKGGVPVIEDENLVRSILKGKDIKWHGKHPSNKYSGNGWYTRNIGGVPVTKVMAGNV